MNTQDKIDVMQAYVDGKEIESDHKTILTGWVVSDYPNWDWRQFNYRIKSQPESIWINKFTDGCHIAYSTEAAAMNASNRNCLYYAKEFKEKLG